MNKIFITVALFGLVSAVPLSMRGAGELEHVKVATDTDAVTVQYGDVTESEAGKYTKESFLEIQTQTVDPLPFNFLKDNIDCSKDSDGSRMNNLVGQSTSGSFTTPDVGGCQKACEERTDCNAFTFMTGATNANKCIMVSACAQFPGPLGGGDDSSVSYVAGCNCIHRYPDEPCECTKPHETITFPDENEGMNVYDPMASASLIKKEGTKKF